MGGVDKGLVEFRALPMISHAVNQVRPLVDQLIISCNRNEPVYQALADITVTDPVEGYDGGPFQGPLMGILAGMRVSTCAQLMVLPCDTPLVNDAVLKRLMDAASCNPDAIIVLAENGRLHPLHAVVPAALADHLETWLSGGQRAVRRWMMNHRMVEVDVSDLSQYMSNLNTSDELRKQQ